MRKPGSTSSEADTARLRYHLISLYILRPIPDDMMKLVDEIDARVESARWTSDGA